MEGWPEAMPVEIVVGGPLVEIVVEGPRVEEDSSLDDMSVVVVVGIGFGIASSGETEVECCEGSWKAGVLEMASEIVRGVVVGVLGSIGCLRLEENFERLGLRCGCGGKREGV